MNDDELNTKFKQIAQLLRKENINVPDNLSGILSLLANSASKEQECVSEEKSLTDGTSKSCSDDNVELLSKVQSIMEGIRSINDPRVNLLTAISPFLNNTRQKKIGNCIKMFQMTQITKMMADLEKDS